jgi:hypothetical protein
MVQATVREPFRIVRDFATKGVDAGLDFCPSDSITAILRSMSFRGTGSIVS